MIRFLLTADWQLGKPYARVSDPDKRARLRQQRLAAIGRLGAVVQQQEAAFVAVVGDLFDSHRRSGRTSRPPTVPSVLLGYRYW